MGNLVGGEERLEKPPSKGGPITPVVIRASVDPAGYKVLKFLLS